MDDTNIDTVSENETSTNPEAESAETAPEAEAEQAEATAETAAE